MTIDRLKYLALAVLLAAGVAGFGLRHWATASGGPADERIAGADDVDPRGPARKPAPSGKDPGKIDEGRPGRRREAVIRLPVGTFVKEVEAAPYGSGRLTWTYEDERVHGLVEGSVMGVEFEVATEAEYSLSGDGTIYGLLTSVRLNHLKLPDGKEFERVKPFVGLWSAVEPLVNEAVTDLPFSYKFRAQGDRLTISNFRMLLAGPNPLGKLGGLTTGEETFAVLAYFQALGTAVEGTYVAPEAKEKPTPARRPLFLKPRRTGEGKTDKER